MKNSIITSLAIVGMCIGLATTTRAANQPAPATQVDPNGNVIMMPPYQVHPDIPVPVKTIPLNVGPEYAGRHIDMTFIVDKNGNAYDIDADATNMPDRFFDLQTASLVTQLTEDIQWWKFEPAHDAAGNPIERAVRLPINVGTQGDME